MNGYEKLYRDMNGPEFKEPTEAQRFFSERLVSGDYDGVVIGMICETSEGKKEAHIWYDNKMHYVSLIGLAEGVKNDLMKSWNTPATDEGDDD